MTLLQMRYFQSVYENQSITRASEHLNVSQPTMSKSIQALEWELGIALFSRVRKRIVPTEAGHLLYEKSKQITILYDMLLADLRSYRTKSNMVNIGIGSMSNIALSQLIHDFSLRNQNISIHLVEMSHSRNLEMLHSGKIDFFIDGNNTGDFLKYSSYEHIVLAQNRMMFCASSQSPFTEMSAISPEEIGQYPLIVLDSDETKDTLSSRIFAASNIKANIVLQTNQMSVIDSMIKNNLAGAFLFESIIPEQDYFYKIPLQPEMIVSLQLVWNRKNLSRPASIFLKYITEAVGHSG